MAELGIYYYQEDDQVSLCPFSFILSIYFCSKNVALFTSSKHLLKCEYLITK